MARTKRKINPVIPAAAQNQVKARIYRTGGYVRLSVEDSGKPGADTIETQKAQILSYIEQQPDMTFCGVFCDNGHTGTNFERPAFEQLMDEIRTGKIDCVVVKDLSRFGRNYLETGIYLERLFPYLNVRFIAINDRFDTLTAERSKDGYIIPLKNMINEAYSKDISRKSSSALATKQRNGEFIGSWAPYGYRKSDTDNHKLEINEETAHVVRMIFQWRLSGVSYLQIARQLNEQDIPAPARYHYMKGEAKSERFASSVWHVAMVKKILLSEVYIGNMVQGRNRNALSEGRKMKQVPKDQWIIVQGTHEALIDEEIFYAVQQIAERNRAVFQERLGTYDALGTTPNIFRGLIFCADCKRPMVRYKNVSARAGNRYYTYICSTHMENPAACPLKGLHEAHLMEILWDTLKQEIALAKNMEKMVQKYNHSERAAGIEASLEQETSDAQRAFDRAWRLHDSLYQSYVDKLVTEQEYLSMRQQYRADMEQAKTRLDEIKQRKEAILKKTAGNPWLAACGNFRSEDALTEEMVRALVDRIEVDAQNHLFITLRYRDECEALVRVLEEAGV